MIAPVAITPGDPGGIGPDLCLQAALDGTLDGVVLADPQLLQARAQHLGLPISVCDALDYDPDRIQGRIYCESIASADPYNRPGHSDPINAGYCLQSLDAAMLGIAAGRFSALVTGPLNKATIRTAGFTEFTGHTEYLRDHYGLSEVVMLLASAACRVALVTTHLPLSAVPQAITESKLLRVIEIVRHSMIDLFALPNPRIHVLGLNPHAGEDGHLGHEELTVITPALNRLREKYPTLHLVGPLPADTAFTPEGRANADVHVAMYHDQGLPVAKYGGFGEAVNITLGLPIIRTSVDHGTALDLAGRGLATTDGLVAAIRQAKHLAALRTDPLSPA